MNIQQRCIKAYEKHKNLKIAAKDVGIPWQTVYVHLKNADVPVTGDKLRYGSETDKLAARGELYFATLVPFAEDQNRNKFQAKFDFLVNGYKVDVKSSRVRKSNTKNSSPDRWGFCSKKQESIADFFVLIGFLDGKPKNVWLVPGEIARHYTTISISCKTRGKWWDYEVAPGELAEFFGALNKAAS